jgi:uncharacterized protein YijF (DUF1287 family)
MSDKRTRSSDKARGPAILAVCLILISIASCQRQHTTRRAVVVVSPPPPPLASALPPNASPQLKQFVEAAIEQSKVTTGYDPSYVGIDYPNGDVSSNTGVCSDVIVRAFRKTGIDLQKEVHEDMTRA